MPNLDYEFKMTSIKALFIISGLLITCPPAGESTGITVNAILHAPVIPNFGIAGSEVDILFNKSGNVAYGIGVGGDLINRSIVDMQGYVSPRLVYTCSNSTRSYTVHMSFGISYTYLNVVNKIETEELNSFGCHVDLIPSFRIGRTFSIGLGSLNSIAFFSKSDILQRNFYFTSRFGIHFGFGMHQLTR